ncbi:hypothetical protein [Tepidicaulis sp.]|uniref:hypothetical protein n=1 Tax=Tepidicaulis sp. TaxID=1920809 RepID=UPI003B592D0F
MRNSSFSFAAPLVGAALLLAACESPGRAQFAPRAEAAPQQQASAPPALDPAPAPASLLGAGADGIRAKLGAPDFVRKEPGAEIWRYGGEACTLLVIFYEEGAQMRASHIDARAPGGGAADKGACVASVNKALQLGARPA